MQRVLSFLRLYERLSPAKPIKIELNSPGGNITEGFHLYDELQRLRAAGHHLTIRVRGEAASMASVILQAADVREVGPNAWVMLHQSSGGAEGKSSDIADAAEYMKRLEHQMCSIYAKRSGKTIKVFKEWLERRKDIWLNAQQAVDMGVADAIA